MISRRSSGSMRAESAVQPTRSENITVIWRRSALSLAGLSTLEGRAGGGAVAFASLARAGMASRSLRRCPTRTTPTSFKSSAVKLARTVASIALSRNAASYCSRPRLRSQAPTSGRSGCATAGSACHRLERGDLAVPVVDAVGENADHELVERARKIGALPPHPLEIPARQGEQHRTPFRRHGGRAQGTAEEPHFADHRMGRDAPHAQGFAAARRDIDGKVAGGDQIDAVGGFALAMEHGRAVEVLAFEIGDEIGWVYVSTELMLQPPGEVAVDLYRTPGKKPVLAPRERDVDVGKGLMPALAADEAAARERVTDGRRDRAEDDRGAVLVAVIAQFGEADEGRRVGSGHHGEIENDIGNPARQRRLDVAADTLEQAFGRTKEDIAGKPVKLDGIADRAQMFARFGRTIDVAGELGAGEVPAHDAEARIADDKQKARAHDPCQHADEIAILDADDHDRDRQQQIEPCPPRIGPPQRIDNEGVAQIKAEARDKGHRNPSGQIKICQADEAENERTRDAAHSAAASGMFQQTAGADLQAAGEASERRGNEAADAGAPEIPGENPRPLGPLPRAPIPW